ncbi:MAG: hypothetical protein H7A01_08195 [Hahellaceae bacterium]|nr:hypothetical protein [Hahellaceae bacterium]MCP5211552.1 hypothetical protein [Hahellaceae bacterium]
MKKFLLAFATLALVATSNALSAQDIETDAAQDDSTAIFESLDANKDASLDKTEAAGDSELTEGFSLIDTDKDDRISSEEYKAHKAQVIKEGQAAS